MHKIVQFGVTLMGALVTSFSQADTADFTIDRERSELVVRLSKGGLAAALAHNHVIRATDFTGQASLDPNDSSDVLISIEVKADSLEVDEPAMRQKYGLTKTVNDGDRQKIQSTMESAAQLNINEHPMMKFQSTHIEKQSDRRCIVTGDLTIHGVMRSITFPATVTQEDRSLRGQATVGFRQSDFGIKPYSVMLGAVRNKDEVVLYLDIVLAPHRTVKATD